MPLPRHGRYHLTHEAILVRAMHLRHDRIAAFQLPQSKAAIIFWIWQTPNARVQCLETLSAFRSIPLRFNVLSVQSGSPVHIICAPIFERTQMSDLSFVPSAARLLLDNMIENATKDSTQVRRSLFVGVTSQEAVIGAVVADSRVQML